MTLCLKSSVYIKRAIGGILKSITKCAKKITLPGFDYGPKY